MSEKGGHCSVTSILKNPAPIMEYTPRPTYGEGRVCAKDGCGTVLTRYHCGSFCYAHEDAAAPETQPEGTATCTRCRQVLPLSEFRLKSKFKDGKQTTWRMRTCTRCVSEKAKSRREKENQRNAQWREENKDENRKRTRDYYYRKRYGFPTREAYWAAKGAAS
jgi:hypothetical protein